MLSLEQSTSDLPKDLISVKRIHAQEEVCGVRNSSPHFSSHTFPTATLLCASAYYK